jgi:hypothetical protein
MNGGVLTECFLQDIGPKSQMVKLLQSATGPALKHHHGIGTALRDVRQNQVPARGATS